MSHQTDRQKSKRLSNRQLRQELRRVQSDLRELKDRTATDSFTQTTSRLHYELSGAPQYYRAKAREIERQLDDPSVEVKELLFDATALVYCSTNFISFIKGLLTSLDAENRPIPYALAQPSGVSL